MTTKREYDWLPMLFMLFAGAALWFAVSGTGEWWRWVAGFLAVFLAYFAGILRGLEAGANENRS